MHTQPLAILSGVRIVSFTQFLLGPAAVQYLADMGADVIKVEPPEVGAWERGWAGGDTFRNGVSVFFLLAHRNLRSVTLNLKHPDGQAIARKLTRQADVVVENFRPGVMERLGLGYQAVVQENPRVVYASASAFGHDSPYRHLPGQDLLIQAISGLTTVTGRASEPPTPAGAAVVDQHGATLLAMGILAALLHRERTGQGQRIEVTMLESALDLQLEPFVYWLNGGKVARPKRPLGSSFHPAPYGIYPTRDGHVALSLSPVQQVRQALGVPEEALAALEDPAVALDKREEIYAALEPVFRTRSTAEWVELLRSHGVWCAPVQRYPEALSDPAVKHLDPLLELDHPRAGRVRLLKHPIRYSAGTPTVQRMPPELGEHTHEVLLEFGYTADDVERLRADGAI
jgi:crotonobetainyl-CoA:carnitine CoA-transferase CaiB-like acyl-CoA transferase